MAVGMDAGAPEPAGASGPAPIPAAGATPPVADGAGGRKTPGTCPGSACAPSGACWPEADPSTSRMPQRRASSRACCVTISPLETAMSVCPAARAIRTVSAVMTCLCMNHASDFTGCFRNASHPSGTGFSSPCRPCSGPSRRQPAGRAERPCGAPFSRPCAPSWC